MAPLISICKRIGQDPLTFPILNTPDRKVPRSYFAAFAANAHVGNGGQLGVANADGKVEACLRLQFRVGTLLGKGAEYGVLEGTIKVAAVLSREDSLCTMQVLEIYNHS